MMPARERVPTEQNRLNVVIGATFLVLLGVVTLWVAQAYKARLDEVRHTVEVQRRVGMLLSTLLDAETGQRGYLVTGEESYLAPYRSARERLPQDTAALRSLIADNDEQAGALQRLQPLIDA